MHTRSEYTFSTSSPSLKHSGQEMFACVWVKRRASNVFEMKIGRSHKTGGMNLCHDKAFTRSNRVTQSSKSVVV